MSNILKKLGDLIVDVAGPESTKILKEGFKKIASDAIEKGSDVIKESVTVFTEEASEAMKEKAKEMKEEGNKKKPERKFKVVKPEED